MNRHIYGLVIVILATWIAGCSTTGYSVGGTVTAPKTVSVQGTIPSELDGYKSRYYSVLEAHGFAVGISDDPGSLRLSFGFDPNPFATTVRVTLSEDSGKPVAVAEAVNNGWGTVMARRDAISNLVDATVNKFAEQLSAVRFVHVADHNSYVACYQRIFQDPALQLISSKVALGSAENQPFTMLSNNAKPSELERAALRKWGEMMSQCMRVRFTLPSIRSAHDGYKNLIMTDDSNEQSLLIELINGNLTYGGFANKRRELAVSFSVAVNQLQARLQREAAEYALRERSAAAAEERAERSRQADFFDALADQQRRSKPTTTTTNCRDQGFGQVTCTTW